VLLMRMLVCLVALACCERPSGDGGACVITGVAYAAGVANPDNPCERCDPSADRALWTARAAGFECRVGSASQGPAACDGSGACRAVTDAAPMDLEIVAGRY
jgi:hypothetical protein